MSIRVRRAMLAILAILVLVAIVATSASSNGNASSHGNPLAGTWSGYMHRTSGGKVLSHHLRIVVGANERSGSWRISAHCRGPLRLKNISDGYHHYTELLAPGATCQGGGIDCLKRAGAGLYDTFQSPPGTSYNSDGTLRRVAS